MKITKEPHNCKIRVCPGALCPECDESFKVLYRLETKKINAEMCAGCALNLFEIFLYEFINNSPNGCPDYILISGVKVSIEDFKNQGGARRRA